MQTAAFADPEEPYAAHKERSMANVKDMRNPYMPGRADSCGCQGNGPEQAGGGNSAGSRAEENCPCGDRMRREMRMSNRMERSMQMRGRQGNMRPVPMQERQENMRPVPMRERQENMRPMPMRENRMTERRPPQARPAQPVQNQPCNKSRYIADVYELGFVMVETALYLDTHPDDGEALAFYADMKRQYAEAVRLYNENVGPLSFYHVTNENYWNWVATPMPWEMEG